MKNGRNIDTNKLLKMIELANRPKETFLIPNTFCSQWSHTDSRCTYHHSPGTCLAIFPCKPLDCPARKTIGVRTVITIIGSTKFRKEIITWAWEKTKDSYLILFAPFAKEEIQELEKYRDELEMQHEQKIMMADIVMVFNKGGYIGKQTKEELFFAESLNKEIIYLEEVDKID